MKLKYLFFIIPVIAYIILGNIYIKKKWKKDQAIFYNTALDGEMVDVYDDKGVTCFRVTYDYSKQYRCWPLISGDVSFYSIAKKWACITKPAKSDTIILMCEGKEYKFLFMKP